MRKYALTAASLIGSVVCIASLALYFRKHAEKQIEVQKEHKNEAKSNSSITQNGESTEILSSQREKEGSAQANEPSHHKKEVISVKEEKEEKLSEDDMRQGLELLKRLKEKANLSFQENRYEDAIEGYQYCIDIITAMGNSTPELVYTSQIIRANVVMVLLRLNQFESAAMVASMLIDDASHPLPKDLLVKVLYRRGLASKSVGNINAALADFSAAVQFSPSQRNIAAEREIAMLNKNNAKKAVEESKLAKNNNNMFT